MKDFEKMADEFLKNELGVFKSESIAIESLLGLQSRLRDIELFKKRGQRRQEAFVKSEGFELALRFAAVDYLLSPAEVVFWKSWLNLK